MKKLTLGTIAGGLILMATFLAAIKDIGGFIPYAYAEDVEKIQENDIRQDAVIEQAVIASQAQFKILRLERKQDRLERKEILTDFEQDELEEVTDEIEKLEDDLGQ